MTRPKRNSEPPKSTPPSNSGPRQSLGSQPPGGSGRGTKGVQPSVTFEGDCGVDVPLYVFTARTCLELLPQLDNVQVEAEIKHLKALDASIHEKLKDKLNVVQKRDILHRSLTTSLMKQIDTVVSKYDLLLESVSRSVETAEKKIDEAQAVITQRLHEAAQQVEELQSPTSPTPPPEQIRRESDSDPLLEDPVRFLDISFSDIDYNDVENSFNPIKSLPGNRTAMYFGSVGYSYGHRGQITHEPANYPPDNTVLREIFTRIHEHDATLPLPTTHA